MDVPTLGQLDPLFGFGLNSNINDHFIPIGHNQAVCVIGSRVAVVSTGSEEPARPDAIAEPMNFLPHSKSFRRITAIASDLKRKTLAVCVEVDLDKTTAVAISPFQVIIYTLSSLNPPKKSRTLTYPCEVNSDGQVSESSSFPFTAAAFSENGLFVAITEEPQSKVIGWQWQKNKIVFLQATLSLSSDIEGGGNAPNLTNKSLHHAKSTPNMTRTKLTTMDKANSDINQNPHIVSPSPSPQNQHSNLPRRRQTGGFDNQKVGSVKEISAGLEVTRVRFHPDDPNIISTSGPQHVRLWRIVTPSAPEDIKSRGKRAYLEPLPAVKRMPMRDVEEAYTDHAWTMDRRLVVVSSYGHVTIITDGDCREGCALRFCLGFGKQGGGRSISTLVALPNTCGFVVGGEEGVLAYFEPIGSRLQSYRIANIVAASKSGSMVTCLAMEFNDMTGGDGSGVSPFPSPLSPATSSIPGLGMTEISKGVRKQQSLDKEGYANKMPSQNSFNSLSVPSHLIENIMIAFKSHIGFLGIDAILNGIAGVSASLEVLNGVSQLDGESTAENINRNMDGSEDIDDDSIGKLEEVHSVSGDLSIAESSIASISSTMGVIEEGHHMKAPHGLAHCFVQSLPGKLSNTWHGGPIISLSICSGGSSLPLVATCCAEDATVKIWNYRKGTCVLTHSFAGGHGQTPRAVAIHPNGMKLLVGFDDNFSLYHLSLVDGLILNHVGGTKGAVILHGNGEDGEATHDTTLITDRITSLSFHKSGDSFAILTGKTLQVYSMHCDLGGGNVTRVQVMSGHHSDVACWGFSQDLTKVHTAAGDGALFEWDVSGRVNKNRILKRSKDCVRSDISYLALDSVEDGALVASSYYKPPQNIMMSPPSPSSFNAVLPNYDILEEIPTHEKKEFETTTTTIGGREAKGFAPPSSLATMASVAQAGIKFKSKLKAAQVRKASKHSMSSSSKVLHRGTTSASLLSIENDHSMLQADYMWANHHALLTIWPSAALEGGRVDVPIPESIGALSALAVVPGGYGGRQGLPSVLLAASLTGKLVAYPWPIDKEACQLALELGEQGSIEPKAVRAESEAAAAAEIKASSGTKSRGISHGIAVGQTSPEQRSNAISLMNPLSVVTHSGAVAAIGLSPDGDMVVSAGRDGSLFVTMLRKSGTGNAVKLAAASEFRSRQPDGIVHDSDMVVTEGKVLAMHRRQLIDLTRRVKEADATLKFELQTCENNHKASIINITSEFEEQIASLKNKVFELTLECKECRETSLKTAEESEIEYREAADELVSVYESKLQVCAQNIDTLQKKLDQLSTSKDISVGKLQEKIESMESDFAAELKKEKEKVAKEQLLMKNYVEFVKNKYKQVLDEEEQRHDQEVIGISNRQSESYQSALDQLEEAKRQKGTIERKNKELTDRMNQTYEEGLHAKEALKSSKVEILKLKQELSDRDQMLKNERQRGGQWEDIAAQHAEEVKLLEKTKQVREHELHSMRVIIPKREGEVARAKKTLSEMNKVLEEQAEERKAREEITKQMKAKHAWLETRLKKEAERNDKLQRGLARVAQQLNTLVAAQAKPEARKILDVKAWVEELSRLHDLVAPLINTNNTLDEKDLDLAKQQQDTHDKQLRYMEKSVKQMRQKIESKHLEGKATAARLREENMELLETVAELKRTVTKKSADVRHLKTEAVKLRGVARDVSSSGYGGRASKSVDSGQDLLQWKTGHDPSAHWPKPRSKLDLAVSSNMVPSNLSRSSGLNQLSATLRQFEVNSALEREDRLQAMLLEERSSTKHLVVALEDELQKHLGSPKAKRAKENARKTAISATSGNGEGSSSVSSPKNSGGEDMIDSKTMSFTLPMLN